MTDEHRVSTAVIVVSEMRTDPPPLTSPLYPPLPHPPSVKAPSAAEKLRAASQRQCIRYRQGDARIKNTMKFVRLNITFTCTEQVR